MPITKQEVRPSRVMSGRAIGRLISGNGRCPKCGGYEYIVVPGIWRRAICPNCECIFIRLTGCEAYRHNQALNIG